MDDRYQLLILIHRVVGYPTAFVVAPAAILAFARPAVHRKWGKAYLYLLAFLYLTGTFLTFARHEWHSWEFARNIMFNFFGFSMVLYGWRAIHLFRQAGQPAPTRLDWALAGMLTARTPAEARLRRPDSCSIPRPRCSRPAQQHNFPTDSRAGGVQCSRPECPFIARAKILASCLA